MGKYKVEILVLCFASFWIGALVGSYRARANQNPTYITKPPRIEYVEVPVQAPCPEVKTQRPPLRTTTCIRIGEHMMSCVEN